jgi:hypothetical protein
LLYQLRQPLHQRLANGIKTIRGAPKSTPDSAIKTGESTKKEEKAKLTGDRQHNCTNKTVKFDKKNV